ncbi:hypothetical protein HK101_007840 [Irineochytrium annulatum]|nr:hypothetical protein HK101_007840 [Irineochytrium annulatum]
MSKSPTPNRHGPAADSPAGRLAVSTTPSCIAQQLKAPSATTASDLDRLIFAALGSVTGSATPARGVCGPRPAPLSTVVTPGSHGSFQPPARRIPAGLRDDLIATLTEEIARERERLRVERLRRRERHGDIIEARRRSIAGYAGWQVQQQLPKGQHANAVAAAASPGGVEVGPAAAGSLNRKRFWWDEEREERHRKLMEQEGIGLLLSSGGGKGTVSISSGGATDRGSATDRGGATSPEPSLAPPRLTMPMSWSLGSLSSVASEDRMPPTRSGSNGSLASRGDVAAAGVLTRSGSLKRVNATSGNGRKALKEPGGASRLADEIVAASPLSFVGSSPATPVPAGPSPIKTHAADSEDSEEMPRRPSTADKGKARADFYASTDSIAIEDDSLDERRLSTLSRGGAIAIRKPQWTPCGTQTGCNVKKRRKRADGASEGTAAIMGDEAGGTTSSSSPPRSGGAARTASKERQRTAAAAEWTPYGADFSNPATRATPEISIVLASNQDLTAIPPLPAQASAALSGRMVRRHPSNPSISNGHAQQDEGQDSGSESEASSSASILKRRSGSAGWPPPGAGAGLAGWEAPVGVSGREAEKFITALNSIVGRQRRGSVDSRVSVGSITDDVAQALLTNVGAPVTLQEGGASGTSTPTSSSVPAFGVVGRHGHHAHPIALSVSVSSSALGPQEEGRSVAAEVAAVSLATRTALARAADLQRHPVIDCSDVFPEAVGVQRGLFVFRIENMRPEIMSFDQLGRFCVADCYIILSSSDPDDGAPHPDDDAKLTHRIFTWIGGLAEMDKRFCCAMYAVGLKNLVGAADKVERVTDLEESPEFTTLFGGSLEHLDESFATESGLFVAENRQNYPLRVYRVQGRINVHLQLVEPSQRSLEPHGVYLVDGGVELMQWNGASSGLGSRSKCRMFAEAINASERVGRAQYIEMDEGDEDPRLWELLRDEGDEENVIDSGDRIRKDTTVTETVLLRPIALYKAPEILEQDSEDEKDDASEAEKRKEDYTDPVRNVVVSGEKLRRALLNTKACFVLDVGVEVFLWIGKGANENVKAAAGEMMARIIRLCDRPSWLSLHRAIEGHEPESFKLRFPDWAELDPSTKLLQRPPC